MARQFYCMAVVGREIPVIFKDQWEKSGCEKVTAFGRAFVAESPVCARHQMENYMQDNGFHFFEVVVSGQSINLDKKRGKK